jgi:hypothetical protein
VEVEDERSARGRAAREWPVVASAPDSPPLLEAEVIAPHRERSEVFQEIEIS